MPQMVGWKWIEIKHNNEREEPKEHKQQHNSNNKKARHNNKHVRGTSHPPGHHGTPLMNRKNGALRTLGSFSGETGRFRVSSRCFHIIPVCARRLSYPPRARMWSRAHAAAGGLFRLTKETTALPRNMLSFNLIFLPPVGIGRCEWRRFSWRRAIGRGDFFPSRPFFGLWPKTKQKTGGFVTWNACFSIYMSIWVGRNPSIRFSLGC